MLTVQDYAGWRWALRELDALEELWRLYPEHPALPRMAARLAELVAEYEAINAMYGAALRVEAEARRN